MYNAQILHAQSLVEIQNAKARIWSVKLVEKSFQFSIIICGFVCVQMNCVTRESGVIDGRDY